jgi:hypothetical protein
MEDNREQAVSAIRVWLVLAKENTNTVERRCQIAAGIIFPKIHFVARHAWPSRH